MPSPAGEPADERIRREAADWAVRMDGPEAERVRLPFERWRAADPRHRRVYAEMEEIRRLARRLGEMPSGQAHLARRSSFVVTRRWRVAAMAASVLLVVGGGVSLWRLRDAPLPGPVSLATRVGELRHVVLADGTRVTLDTDSAVEERFTASERLVRLVRGRARFDVAPGVGRPFMVAAGDRIILDRGTVFDVGMGREGVKVTLLRGAVEVRGSAAGGGGAAPVRLVPGQVFASAASAGAPLVSAAPRGGEQWVSGMLSFDGAALGDVVAEANRDSAHRIVLGDPALASLRVTGTFRAGPAETLAPVLATALGLRTGRDGQGSAELSR